MQSRTLLNLGLLALLAGLITMVVFEPGLEPPAAPGTLTDLDRDTIYRIDLERAGKPALTLKRIQDRWSLEREPALPAAPFRIESLLGLLNQQWIREYTADSLNLDRIGLQPPQTLVRYNESTEIALGGTDALEGHRYIHVGSHVYLISDAGLAAIRGDWTDFVSPGLFPENTVIEGLELPGQRLRQTDGKWQLTPPQPDISADAVTMLVDAWRHASALWVEEQSADSTGEPVSIRVSGRPEPVLFRIVETDPELILARPDLKLQYHLPGEAARYVLTLNGDSTETTTPSE